MAFQRASAGADHRFDGTRPRRARKDLSRSAEESDEDRISALPDDLLRRVLSFLPAHEAVRTCALSRRWREVWKFVRVLRFTAAETWGSPARFNRFVNGMLSFSDSAPLEEFEVKTYIFMPHKVPRTFKDPEPEEPVRYLNTWIQYALMRDVQVLRVLVNSWCRLLVRVDVPLVSQHLRILVLKSVVLDGCSTDFSSCPALEDLELRNCQITVRKISSQSIRMLFVNNCDFSGDICTQILAPNLLSLRLDVDGGRVPFLRSMPLLVTAYVSIGLYCRDRCWHSCKFVKCGFDTCIDCYGNHDSDDKCMLFGGLSNATHLELATKFYFHAEHIGAAIFKRDMKLCPMFNNLKSLVLEGWAVVCEVDALISFLQYAPILEKITLQIYNELRYELEMDESCSSLEKFIPSEHLKIVEVKCIEVVENVHKFVRILNTYGIYSDLISIQETDSGST